MENMTPPDNMGGNMMTNGETFSVFTIAKSGNLFVNVCPVVSTK